MKIKKVTIEYENGRQVWLAGDEAARWEEAIDRYQEMAQIHGNKTEHFDWKTVGDDHDDAD